VSAELPNSFGRNEPLPNGERRRQRPARTPATTPGQHRTCAELLSLARQTQQLRTLMKKILPSDLFVDPAWDMMVELMVAEGTDSPLYVKDLMLLTGESAASTCRRISRLQEEELLDRHPDPQDHRRVRVTLTDQGHAAMAMMLRRLFNGSEPDSDAPVTPISFRPGRPKI